MIASRLFSSPFLVYEEVVQTPLPSLGLDSKLLQKYQEVIIPEHIGPVEVKSNSPPWTTVTNLQKRAGNFTPQIA